MRVLLLGAGGCEHALAQAIFRSLDTEKDTLLVAPGNAGTLAFGDNVRLPDDLVTFCRDQAVDLVVLGSAEAMVRGEGDRLREAGIPVFGPGAQGARLEASKSFAKEFMARHGIPTPSSRVFEDPAAARDYLESHWNSEGLVVKADGLAGGRGTIVALTPKEAIGAIFSFMERKVLGAAGERVLIEPRREGPELSVLVVIDGERYALLPAAQDHKTRFEGGRGPNTGGMGAIAPTRLGTDEILAQIEREIVEPTVSGLVRDGIDYRGVLYFGVMLTEACPEVLEFNCRFGDPEAQVVLPGIADVLGLLEACASGSLVPSRVRHDGKVRVCIVGAAPGYPEEPLIGQAIDGLDEAVLLPGITVFHDGTRLCRQRGFLTHGGRVLGVTAEGEDLLEAQERAYKAVHRISFEAGGPYFRHDIGVGSLAGVG
ncbi:MAG: phosphoribosylamine--glycine ligase [Cyanobacteria bacterium REEB65]|nr:phosphoribosylamine--glycine ligase [Cyanobacteria bacterium REEB65]